MFQPKVNASSYQIRRRYFRLQKFIRLCIEMRYLVIFISMISMGKTLEAAGHVTLKEFDASWGVG